MRITAKNGRGASISREFKNKRKKNNPAKRTKKTFESFLGAFQREEGGGDRTLRVQQQQLPLLRVDKRKCSLKVPVPRKRGRTIRAQRDPEASHGR